MLIFAILGRTSLPGVDELVPPQHSILRGQAKTPRSARRSLQSSKPAAAR